MTHGYWTPGPLELTRSSWCGQATMRVDAPHDPRPPVTCPACLGVLRMAVAGLRAAVSRD